MTKPAKKATGPKAVSAHGIGHNSGQKIPALIKLVDELLDIGDKKKSLGKAERDLRNKAKTEFGILPGPLAHELRLRKMDEDVRVQFESNHGDLKTALGYQPSLDFEAGVPTKQSVKAQPAEAAMPVEPEPEYEVEDEEDEEPDTVDNSDLEIPENLKRNKRAVIEREG